MSEPSSIESVPVVSTYRREVCASMERVLENVLDWEHLPWLHRSTFGDISLVEAGDWGWTAWVEMAPRGSGARSLVDLRFQSGRARYVTRTVEGLGRGTVIETSLERRAEQRTGIEVSFRIPDLSSEAASTVGAGWVALYTQLWDEDETMMARREELLRSDRPASSSSSKRLDLGAAAALRAELPMRVSVGAVDVRVVETENGLTAYETVCPHLGGPLDEAPIDGNIVTCPWHGYRFDVATGKALDGRRCRLTTGSVEVGSEGDATLVFPAARS